MSATEGGAASDALSRMVRAFLDEPGQSLRRLTEITIDPETGYTPGTTWLHKLGQNKVGRAPEPQALRALAAGLRRPLVEVQRAAAAQYLDYRATELSGYPDDVQAIVAHLTTLDPQDLPQVRAVIEKLRRNRGADGPA
ncbi:hypothetical protein P3T37_004035 [Kitasatospora sp. MAA4]|uniref:hypothetical protein n=1 Tax=Kitasatospora sp. MAA4 TaxID=3035093 RepID=UPI002473D3CD|nr:hypothetical protein [Kitasatospora sp. MAA4]MDH6134631.1 hypothetical protein [Kitasatospora sp. MAA4]